MAYVGQPTALRAPLYPLLLAGFEALFASHYLLILRLIQSLLSVLSAWVCAKTARLLWNEQAKWPAFAVAMRIPTLLFFTTQITTESFAAFFIRLFLYFLVQFSADEKWNALIGMGICCGILMLLRFNTLFLPLTAALAAIRFPLSTASFKRALVPLVLAFVIVSPWLVRNFIVFHGDIFYSSQTGTTAFQGALEPEGRTQSEGLLELKRQQGWWLSMIEIDRPSRLNYPSEVELNRQARSAAILAWKGLGFQILPLPIKKTGYFWLSTDQLLDTSSLLDLHRKLHAVGVLVYWVVLFVASVGWLRLRKSTPRIAHLLLLYCVLAIALHLPFTMSTRLRVPLIDPAAVRTRWNRVGV
jgi:4-amino-4-deoxy-L-arabinose transferase-like glycosyltransferase